MLCVRRGTWGLVFRPAEAVRCASVGARDTASIQTSLPALPVSPPPFPPLQFLSEDEAEALKALGAPRLTKSMVVDSATGGSKDSDVRTSSGTFLSRGQTDLVSRIEDRIALVSMVPKENGEGLQILKYVDGQKYEPRESKG